MKFYNYGDKNAPVIMLLPETVRISGGHTATLMKSDEYIEAVKKFVGKL